MSYNEALDDENKYHLSVNNGRVSITRYGDEWLENPEGSKAWIAAADTIEQLRKTAEAHMKVLEVKYRDMHKLIQNEDPESFNDVAKKLAKSYGWSEDFALGVVSQVFSKLVE